MIAPHRRPTGNVPRAMITLPAKIADARPVRRSQAQPSWSESGDRPDRARSARYQIFGGQAYACATSKRVSAVFRMDLATQGTSRAARCYARKRFAKIMRVEFRVFGEAMRRESMKITPNAILSRSLAAIVERSL